MRGDFVTYVLDVRCSRHAQAVHLHRITPGVLSLGFGDDLVIFRPTTRGPYKLSSHLHILTFVCSFLIRMNMQYFAVYLSGIRSLDDPIKSCPLARCANLPTD